MSCECDEPTKLLVADYEEPFLEAIRGSFASITRPVSVASTSSVPGVLEAVNEGEIDGVVVGDTVAESDETITRISEVCEAPIILLTSDVDDEGYIRRCVEAGLADYFPRISTQSQCEIILRSVERSSGSDRESSRRTAEHEEILDAVNDTVAVFNRGGEILHVNESYYDKWGYDDLESVQEQGIKGLSAAENGYTEKKGKALIREVAETRKSKTVRWEGVTKSGEHRLTETELTPVEIGGRMRVLSSQRDITERKRREREYEQIFNKVNDAIAVHDPHAEDPMVEVNDTLCEMLGYEREELLKIGVEGFTAEEAGYDAAEQFDVVKRVIQSKEPEVFEWKVETANGENRWVEVNTTPATISGNERVLTIARDITTRKKRQQQISSFHDATEQLTGAESHQEASVKAVEAAQEVLGFSFVSVHLYSEETGKLEPIAETKQLEEADGELSSLGPGSSVPWQVYVDGETVTNPDLETPVYEPAGSEPKIVLPLGSHGVMLVGASSDGLSEEHIDLTQMLAATLEAALNHVAGREALAQREEELKEHQERADQLERLNTIIRDIERVTVEQSSRGDIEEAVCEQLIEIDFHECVWIAEPSVRDDKLVPRTGFGGRDAYINSLSLDLNAGPSGHPSIRAYQNDKSEAITNVATDAVQGEWRSTALRHGIQSVVSAPISYQGKVYGVLTIAGKEPGAFDESVQAVFEELGRSIGYEISVTERKESLESAKTAELEFTIREDGLFFVNASASAECEVTLERTIRRSGGEFSTFYLVENADPQSVVDLAREGVNVKEAQVVGTDDEARSGIIEVTAPTWFGAGLTERGAIVRKAAAVNGNGTIVVELTEDTDIRSLVQDFQERYPTAELVAKRRVEQSIQSVFEIEDVLQENLTDRQWETLQTAYSAGYFHWPRKSSGEEVAELLGVTQPTFSKHLRLAEQQAIQILMEQGYASSE